MNVLDYLDWRGDLTFNQDPLQEVDALIFSRFSYLLLDGIVPGTFEMTKSVEKAVAEFNRNEEQQLLWPDDGPMMRAAAANTRFCGCGLTGYVNQLDPDQQKQFAALTAVLEDGKIFVSFRGTDNTLIGWKEDFNMSFMTTVPAQLDAVEYLERAATAYTGEIYVGGHSKGGNLAVYAAAFCSPETQKRIHTVYNMDGPGFAQEVIEKPGYARICSRIHTYIPQSSVVGMLLEHEEAYTIVHSTQSGLMQHNVYSWEVLRNHLIELETVTKSSRFIDQTLKTWLKEMDPSYRGKIIDTIYELFAQTDARTVSELTSNWYQNVSLLLKSWKKVDPQTQEYLREMMRLLLKAVRENVEIWLPRTDAS